MISLLSIIVLGFFLGMRHATDSDHVIAVTTIVARYRKVGHAALIGAFWGLGHTLTILFVGGGIILFGWVIPPRVGLSMEFSVGLMLIVLGVLNLTGMLQWIQGIFSRAPGMGAYMHSHAYTNGDYMHIHPHGHEPDAHPHDPAEMLLHRFDHPFRLLSLYETLRPLVVGIVHGLAGSAAVALLVLTTIRNPRWGIGYLLVFGAGTIAGMTLITGALVLPFACVGTRFARINRGLRVASGLISVAFGLFLAYEIGLMKGLFTSYPQWTPR
jgi:high-affinity nickel-transport protein